MPAQPAREPIASLKEIGRKEGVDSSKSILRYLKKIQHQSPDTPDNVGGWEMAARIFAIDTLQSLLPGFGGSDLNIKVGDILVHGDRLATKIDIPSGAKVTLDVPEGQMLSFDWDDGSDITFSGSVPIAPKENMTLVGTRIESQGKTLISNIRSAPIEGGRRMWADESPYSLRIQTDDYSTEISRPKTFSDPVSIDTTTTDEKVFVAQRTDRSMPVIAYISTNEGYQFEYTYRVVQDTGEEIVTLTVRNNQYEMAYATLRVKGEEYVVNVAGKERAKGKVSSTSEASH